jgi:preprotein translocase subunit SecE
MKTKDSAEAKVGKKGLIRKLHDFRVFFDQSKVELKKVVWPNKQETLSTGSAVLLLVVVLAIFLGTIDFILAKIIASILS